MNIKLYVNNTKKKGVGEIKTRLEGNFRMDKKQKITFEYRYAVDFRAEYIMGVWGGLNPRGLIEMNFYTEHRSLPCKTTHAFEGGKLIGTAEVKEPEVEPLIRVFKHGILVDLGTAESIYKWLGDKIKMLKQSATLPEGGVAKDPSQKQEIH